MKQPEHLQLDGCPILSSLAPLIHTIPDPTGAGVFLHVSAGTVKNIRDTTFSTESAPAPDSRLTWSLGMPVSLRRFLACHRFALFWMAPKVGSALADVPPETQCLLMERTDGRLVLMVPLIDKVFRYSLQVGSDGLELLGETNDPFTTGSGGVGAFVATGFDPYELLARGAAAVARYLAPLGCRLRKDKPLPDFMDLFGWCTWDAFYADVSPAGIRQGLQSLTNAGVAPRLLILDDGWLSIAHTMGGGERLTSFSPNHKFGGTLQPTVAMAKHEFGVQRVLAWHAIVGSWGGAEGERLPDYGIRDTPRCFGSGILQVNPAYNHMWGGLIGLPGPADIERFYDDFHRLLAAQGIDGVKVDVQAVLEGCATGAGGRVALIQAYRQALEGSVARHFSGRLINCMSHNTETWYLSPGSNLTRFSDDFYPNRSESHGAHLWINAALGGWFGEFQHADWDMFQSKHPQGAFHAAGRAVSGSPVYVSDKPDAHDPELLRKLVLADGTVARAQGVGRISPDGLFRDPRTEPCLLKIFNHNLHGSVVGAFNAHSSGETVTGSVSVADVPGESMNEPVLYSHRKGTVQRGGSVALSLPPMEWDVITIAPIHHGLAVIGLAHLLNSGGAIHDLRWEDRACQVHVRDGGQLVAWCVAPPASVQVNGCAATFRYESNTGLLTVAMAGPAICQIKVT